MSASDFTTIIGSADGTVVEGLISNNEEVCLEEGRTGARGKKNFSVNVSETQEWIADFEK